MDSICDTRKLLELTPYPTNLLSLKENGVLMTRLGGVYPLLSNVVDKLLRGRVSEEVFVGLKQGIQDTRDCIIPGDSNMFFVYVTSSAGFNTFNGMVCNLNYSEGMYSEYTLSVDCMFTTDEGFDQDLIPFFDSDPESQADMRKYTNGEKTIFDREKIYMFRVVSREAREGLNGFRHKIYEYVIYLPKTQFRRYS